MLKAGETGRGGGVVVRGSWPCSPWAVVRFIRVAEAFGGLQEG